MSRWLSALLLGVALAGSARSEADARQSRAHTSGSTSGAPAEAQARGSGETVWGGTDASGVAVEGGVWDFEGGPSGNLQGWTSIDRSDVVLETGGVPVRRVTSATFLPDDIDGTITAGGSSASVWFGALSHETLAGCWPGRQGYSNDWGLNMSKLFTWGGSGDVTIELDYFVDSETGGDFSYVYVINSSGEQSALLNPGGLGWSGASESGDNIGTPSAPAHETMTAPESFFYGSVNGPAFEVIIRFGSGPVLSDGLDELGGFVNSVYGPLGVDNVHVTGVALDDLSDFEAGEDGWLFYTDPAVGNHMQVKHLDALDPVGDPIDCPLTDHVLVAADVGGPVSHPHRQREMVVSPPAYVGAHPGERRSVRFDIWEALPRSGGVGLRVGMHYYPWVCPVTHVAGWTVEPLDQGDGDEDDPLSAFLFDPDFGGPTCGTFEIDNTPGMPADVDSIKIVFEVLSACDDFNITSCTDNTGANQSPYLDNVQLVSVEDINVAVGDPGTDGAPSIVPGGARPNPFTASTTIRFELNGADAASVNVLDVSGRNVRGLWRQTDVEPGRVEITWDGRNDQGAPMPSGLYYYTIVAGAESRQGRIVLLR